MESAVEAGKGQPLICGLSKLMGRGQLHTVVPTQGKGISKAAGRLNKLLADFHNRAQGPAPDQLLTCLLQYIGVIGAFPLPAGHTCHGLSPRDAANRYRICCTGCPLHLI